MFYKSASIAVVLFILIGLFAVLAPTPTPQPPPPTEIVTTVAPPPTAVPTTVVPPTSQPTKEKHKKTVTPTPTSTWVPVIGTPVVAGEVCELTCYESLQLTASALTNQRLLELINKP